MTLAKTQLLIAFISFDYETEHPLTPAQMAKMIEGGWFRTIKPDEENAPTLNFITVKTAQEIEAQQTEKGN